MDEAGLLRGATFRSVLFGFVLVKAGIIISITLAIGASLAGQLLVAAVSGGLSIIGMIIAALIASRATVRQIARAEVAKERKRKRE